MSYLFSTNCVIAIWVLVGTWLYQSLLRLNLSVYHCPKSMRVFFLVNSWDNKNHSCYFSNLLEDGFSSVRPIIQSRSRADLITGGWKKNLYIIFLEARPTQQRSYDKGFVCQPTQTAAVAARGASAGECTDRKTSLSKLGK